MTNPEPSYFTQRMKLLGITEADNQVRIWQNENGTDTLNPLPVFRETEKGIDILVYTLDRLIINYKPDGSRWSKNYCLTRLEKPITRRDGSVQKYYIPKGQGTHPFFHPALIEKYESKTPIKTLFLTEGYFKAWKGAAHGLNIIGLSSITHLKEKDTGKLHSDIKRIILTCQVKRVVWLTDGDCLDITSKDLTDGIDLYKRPKNFFSSCSNFRDLLDDCDVEKYFFHINSDEIISASTGITRDDVKGLDDLLISFPEKIPAIIADAETVNTGTYFIKHNITFDIRRIHAYFHLGSVTDFYLFHVQRRPELKNIEFIFAGTRYKYDEKDNECKIITPAAAKLYFRVGDGYYKFIEKINQDNQIEKGFVPRLKSTIVDDHGKKFIEHIPKYETFINYPDHQDYQQVKHNGFNVYSPFEHEPLAEECTEEDCPTIIAFFRHIFGEKDINVTQQNGEAITTKYYQLGIDYVQLLYQKPTQRLPILCLVSRENETGKSTFFDLMKAIFTNNACVVGNADLADDFNSFWAPKLLIMCDETKIDKMSVVERVKSLTFAKKIPLSSKGKDKSEIDFFGHFMMTSNNEDNFIYANEFDTRYWILKIPRIKNRNPDFLKNMLDEIPAFLSYISKRKLATPRSNRMWFDEKLLRTDALQKVIAYSHSTVKKELCHYLREMFLDFGVTEIHMTCKAIRENFFRNKEENYIERVLKEEMHLRPIEAYYYKGTKYDTEEQAVQAVLADKTLDCKNPLEALHWIKRKGVVTRHKYPKWHSKVDMQTGKMERVRVEVQDNGRPYQFLRADFVPESEEVELSDELRYEAEIMASPSNGNGHHHTHSDNAEKPDELPF